MHFLQRIFKDLGVLYNLLAKNNVYAYYFFLNWKFGTVTNSAQTPIFKRLQIDENQFEGSNEDRDLFEALSAIDDRYFLDQTSG